MTAQPIALGAILLLLSIGAPLNPTPVLLAAEHDPAEEMRDGQAAFERGAFEEALTHWKDAAQDYARHGDHRRHGEALVSAAQAAQSLGHTTDALQSLELALALAQADTDVLWRASVQAHLGRTYIVAQQLDAAEDHLTQAQNALKGQQAPALLASITNDRGILAALKHQDREALTAFTETVRQATDAELPLLAVRARINAARANIRLNDFEASRVRLDEAMDQLTAMPASHEKAMGLVNVGLLYGELAPKLPSKQKPLLLRAAGTLEEAATAAETLNDARTLSYAQGYLGRLYESEARLAEATYLTKRAIFAAQSVDAPQSLYRWQWQLGRLHAASGELDKAIDSYQQAVTTLQPIRQEIATTTTAEALSDPQSVRPLFFELSDLLLQRASLTEETPAVTRYIERARDTIESYKAAELRDYFRDQCVDALQSRITKSDTVAPNTAIVYPILFPDRIEVIVSSPEGISHVAVPVPSATVTDEIRAFRRTVEKRTTREYLPHAQRLYEWLISPIESTLRQSHISTLVFVPDSALRTIPMAALHDGSEFLIQKYAIALTPGITLTDPHPLNREKIRFLASGLTTSVQGFRPLPYVKDEIDSIRSLYHGDLLLNQEFQTAKLERELRAGRYGMLHIATHGQFSANVNDSFLLTFDGKLTMGKLDQLIGLFRYRDDPLELLTLSACQTGVGDDRAALGLAGIAIKAGARSALATLWFINDEASATLVSEFYRQLRDQTVSKAVAVQRAQLKLLNDRVYQHPAYWSPFLLLNNWL